MTMIGSAPARDTLSVNVEDERERRLRQALGEGPTQSGEFHLKAPMPGLVVTIPVVDGQEIEREMCSSF